MKEETKAFLKDLTKEELKNVYTPLSMVESIVLEDFTFYEEESIEDIKGQTTTQNIKTTATLHARIKRTCYIAYVKYQYKAWVKIGNRNFKCDEIAMKMNSGIEDFTKKGTNISQLKKLDEIYEYGNACRTSTLVATARKGSATAKVRVKYG